MRNRCAACDELMIAEDMYYDIYLSKEKQYRICHRCFLRHMEYVDNEIQKAKERWVEENCTAERAKEAKP